MEYKVGDYIRYTPEQEQEVIESLLADGQEVLNAKQLSGEEFSGFIYTEERRWCRFCCEYYRREKRDITDEFFDYANQIKDESIKRLEASRSDQGDAIKASIYLGIKSTLFIGTDSSIYKKYLELLGNDSLDNYIKDPDLNLKRQIAQKEKELRELRSKLIT